MRTCWGSRRSLIALAVSAVLALVGCGGGETQKSELEHRIDEVKAIFDVSLHATGAGMKHWYEKGSMALIGAEYEDLDCKNCHVQSCEACHAEGDYAAAVSKDRCLECHSRYKDTIAMDRKAGLDDPHAEMACSRCHPVSDAHGDGKQWASMRDRGFLKADCLSCHETGDHSATTYDSATDSHSAHDNLTCQACHISNSIACMNCHFDRFLETGSRKGNAVKVKNWLLLVNYAGKVTSGTVMSLVGGGKPYATFAPYASHSIRREGRACRDCHGTEAVRAIAAGGQVKLGEFGNGKLTPAAGVIPVIAGGVEIPFLDKNEAGEWIPLATSSEPMVTFSGHATALTSEQLEKLGEAME